jgi:hypothetical protein
MIKRNYRYLIALSLSVMILFVLTSICYKVNAQTAETIIQQRNKLKSPQIPVGDFPLGIV